MTQADSTIDTVSLRSLFAGSQNSQSIPDIPVTDITSDSRKARAGGLFLACEGQGHHGLDFVDQAVAAQVAAVAWEPAAEYTAPKLPSDVVCLEVPKLGALVGDIADRFFSQPSRQLQVTGVTGTNGKTTVARLASSALVMLDNNSAYMGTMGYGLGEELKPSAFTTPGCIVVHRRLRDMVDAGAQSAIIEVSSHGLDQGRIDGVRITTAAITNLSRDHLDYHHDFESYGKAKARLFTRAGLHTAVINVGDKFGAELADQNLSAERIIRVAITDSAVQTEKVDLLAELLDANAAGLRIRFSGKFGHCEISSPMWGRFNVENLVLAAGILIANGFSLEKSANALSQLHAPEGRMQVLRGAAGKPAVVVDFAHTPDAIEQVLRALRDHCAGKIWCIFGCGGDRDQGKREMMGKAAADHADHLVLTDDNPRHEDSAAIIRDIQQGVDASISAEVIADRTAAITAAIHRASADDIVLIAGKGSETLQLIGDQAVPFSDASVAREALLVDMRSGGVH
jgi:UDP-N-acetylmuramoyl-L-alanyl-D-glutamate--2,6-diaminopimelate ligase